MEKLAPVLAAADFTFEFREPQPAAQPHAGDGDVVCGYVGANGRQRPAHRAPASTAPCWPASASASWAPTARASPPGQDHRPRAAPLAGTLTEGKGLAIGYFAQQELDVLRPTTARWST
jgi:ATP-binding cassette subfamily F protein 3